jgi:methionyl-tRNA formyltransferase
MTLRTVFMGSPEFAVPSLRALHAQTQVVAVLCQPDRPAGRGLALVPPAVKQAAAALGLEVRQPESLRPARSTVIEDLRALRPDLIVVVAYGKILPPELLAVPPLGCWNVHGSLLPRYRGAAPIQWALIRGETRTGVTLMQMDAGMDTGPLLLTAEQAIAPDDTAGRLHGSLSQLGADLLREGLERLAAGTLPQAAPQDEALATYAPLLTKDHGRLDFTRRAALVSGQIRGVDPWPGGYTTASLRGDEVVIKVYKPRVSSGRGRPGEVLGADRDGLHVACGEGAVALGELQLPGRKRLPAQAVLSGFPLPPGTILGDQGDQRARENPLLQGEARARA